MVLQFDNTDSFSIKIGVCEDALLVQNICTYIYI